MHWFKPCGLVLQERHVFVLFLGTGVFVFLSLSECVAALRQLQEVADPNVSSACLFI